MIAETKVNRYPILLIDPDEETEWQINDALANTEYDIIRFESGVEGLQAVPEIHPYLIVCEFKTTDIDGKTIFEKFMNDDKYLPFRYIPFVIFSEHQERDQYGKSLFQQGLWGWFTKPFGKHELREVLENLLFIPGIIKRNRELSQEVKRSEFRYRDLLENANDFIFTLDAEGRFVYLNNRFTPLTGWSKESWIGKPLDHLIDGEDREIVLEHYRMAQLGRARVFEAHIQGNLSYSTILSFNITPFLERGKIVGSIGIARDVTEQKKMEKEILDLKNFNESIIQSMEAGLLTADLEGRITSLNAGGERILGWRFDEVAGKTLDEVLEPGEVHILLSNPSPGALPYSRETELLNKSGKKISIGFTSTARLDNKDEKVGTILSFRDISMLKQMQSEVIRMDRLASLGVLASGIAHEIKNPLAGIKTMAQACQEEFEKEDSRIEYLTRIVRQVNRLDDLLKTFFAYARPKQPDRKPHRLEEILREVVNLLGKRMTSCQIQYQEILQKDLLVNVDFQQMQQVFLNLILNAIEAMPDGGQLSIRSKTASSPFMDMIEEKSTSSLKSNGFVHIHLEDTGIGIDPQKLETIFDPFFTTKPNGVGLGLSIVYRIIKEHQGDIRVQSCVQKGTLFTIILPMGE